MLPDEATGFEEGVVEEAVEEDGGGVVGKRLFEGGLRVGAEGDEVEVAEGEGGLAGQVAAEVTFVHGRDGVAAHGGVAVDAVILVVRYGEQIAEDHVAAEVGGSNCDGDPRVAEDLATDFEGPADASGFGGAVESGADFVLG